MSSMFCLILLNPRINVLFRLLKSKLSLSNVLNNMHKCLKMSSKSIKHTHNIGTEILNVINEEQ